MLACAQVEQLADPALPVAEIVAKCPRQQLMAVYNIPAFADADQFLQLVAAARGKLGKVSSGAFEGRWRGLADAGCNWHSNASPGLVLREHIDWSVLHQAELA